MDMGNTSTDGGTGKDSDLTYDHILSYLEEQEWPITSPKLAGEFCITQQAAYYRLKKLYDRGEVERIKIGQTVLWRLAGDED